jgi:hypothetical protein
VRRTIIVKYVHGKKKKPPGKEIFEEGGAP